MKYSFTTRFVKKLANLQLAITLLFTIGLTIAIGTIIEQDQSLTFYKENYPTDKPLFGFLTWKLVTLLNFDHLYTAWWFLMILFLFAGSLIACTFTTQLPSIKTFKLWSFYTQPRQFKSLVINSKVQSETSNAFVYNCNNEKYHFFWGTFTPVGGSSPSNLGGHFHPSLGDRHPPRKAERIKITK